MFIQRLAKSKGMLALAISLLMGQADAQSSEAKASTPKCVPVPEGIVGWWPSDIGVKDRLGRNPGEAGDGLSYTAGKVRNAFSFYVGDAYVKVPPMSDLETGAGLTIECWICPASSANYPIVEWNDGQGHAGAHLWVYDGIGKLFCNLIGPKGESHGITSGPGIIKAGEFQHIAATYDMESGIARLYRNGVLMAEDYLGQFRPTTNIDLYFGYRPRDDHRFRGELDEVSIYNRALTTSEVQAIYGAGSAGKCTPEVDK